MVFFLAISCGSKTTNKNKMGKIEVITTNEIEVKADIVWQKLVAFGGTEKFVPNLIEKVTLKGSGAGAIRNIHLKGGGEIIEKLTRVDNTNRHLEFTILSTPMPISNYTGIFKVKEVTQNKCAVTFISKYQTLAQNRDKMRTVIKEFQETFISNLDK